MEENIQTQALRNINLIAARQLYIDSAARFEQLLAHPKYDAPKRLTRYGFKNYSQCDEDGLIAEIVKRLGDKCPKTFVEFGVESGIECNTLRLALQDWKGVWLEGSRQYCDAMQKTHASLIQKNRLKVQNAFITSNNINELLAENGFTNELGIISIDIDGNDIWIWKALKIKPAIVIIEYNSTWAPPLSIAQAHKPDVMWNGTNCFGSSLNALVKVGHEQGYNLVGCSMSGVNAFFVRADLCGDKFHAPYTAEEHYEPARYWLCHMQAGHPAAMGELVEI